MLRGLFFTSFTFFALLSCSHGLGSKQVMVDNSAQAKLNLTARNTRNEKLTIKNTRGVVVLNKFSKGDFVRFYNVDGSLWYEFSYFYDDRNGRFEYANDEFRPFAFHQDHFLLVLKSTETSDKFFEVVVNEETALRKYVKANDPVLRLETWDDFVLSVFALTFDQKTNPLLESPTNQMKNVVAPASATFRPVEIRGDWLKVSWRSPGEQGTKATKPATGWIRWRNDETLLIDLFYFA